MKRRSDFRDGVKNCLACGTEFRRDPKFSYDLFERKRFCTKSCAWKLRPKRNLAETFNARFERCGPDDCWPWIGTVSYHGYGQVRINGKLWLSNRLCWVITTGNDPGNLNVCHTCDNRICVNPQHLYLGTAKQNADDMVARKRHLFGTRHPTSKLTEEAALTIKRSGLSPAELGRQFGISRITAARIKAGIAWRHLP